MKRVLPLLLALAMPALAARAADETSVEERLRALEQRIEALEKENASLRADVAPKPEAPVPVLAAGKESAIRLGGLLQVQAEAGGKGDARNSNDNDRIYVRRARVNVSGRFLEDFEFRTELELMGWFGNGPDFRGLLTDGYVGWTRWPALELRAGQFKVPFGFEHLDSDAKLSFPERSLGSDRLTLGRQSGLQASGRLADGRFTWTTGAFAGLTVNHPGNDNDEFLVAARVAGVPAQWRVGKHEARWGLGLGAYQSDDSEVNLPREYGFDADPPRGNPLFRGSRHGQGVDTQLTLGPFEWRGEWIETEFDPANDVPSPRLTARSRSTQATWLTAADRLLVGARWDDFDPHGTRDGDATRTWTTSLSWLIRGHDLKLQAAWMNIHAPKPEGLESKLLLRFQLAF